MVSIKDINKNIKKNLFDPIDKTKNKFSSLLNNLKKNKVKKELALQKKLEKKKKRELIIKKKLEKILMQDSSTKINKSKTKAKKGVGAQSVEINARNVST